MNLGGRQRIVAVIATAWVFALFLIVDPGEDRFPSGAWIPFLLIGPGPFVVALSWMWIRNGYDQERLSGKRLPEKLYKQIANHLFQEHKIAIRGYAPDESQKEHVFTIARGKATGRLVFATQFLSDHTDSGVIERIASLEVKRQLDDFDEKRIIVGHRSVVVQML